MAPARRAHFWGRRRSGAKLSTNYSRYGSAPQPAVGRPRVVCLASRPTFLSARSASPSRVFAAPRLRPNRAILCGLAFRVDVVMFHRDRGILCGLASRWICHYFTKIEPYYADWNFGGCSQVHRHRAIVCGFAMHLAASGLRTGHSNSKVCNCRKTEPAVGGTVPRTEKASKVTFLKRESP